MNITAHIENREGHHQVRLTTNDNAKTIDIPPPSNGFGSSVNGGELLFLALATCFCNDIYREAAKRKIRVESVVVEVTGNFGPDGEPATDVRYHTRIAAHADEQTIRALAAATDGLAEVQNTLRVATPVTLGDIDAIMV